jgi:hypothetical protein
VRFNPNQITPNYSVQHLLEQSAPADGGSAPAPVAVEPTFGVSESSTSISARNFQELGVPPALSNVLAEQESDVCLRLYLLDNSGSMNLGDGGIVIQMADGSIWRQNASRWEELVDLARSHAEWNGALNVPAEFILLNAPPTTSPDRWCIAGEDWQQQVCAMVAALKRHWPNRSTPLGSRLEEIRQQLLRQKPAGRVNLTIVTDGVPDNRDQLVQSIRKLMSSRDMNVRLVIRLCTDESSVVQFYNDLDSEVESPLDILDDFMSEAKEIRSKNPFLVYTPVLHRVREAGAQLPVLDFLDERGFTPLEAAFLSQLLIQGEGQAGYSRDPKEFLAAIEPDVARAPLVFDVVSRRFAPPLHMRALRRAVLPTWQGKTLQLVEQSWAAMLVMLLVAILWGLFSS